MTTFRYDAKYVKWLSGPTAGKAYFLENDNLIEYLQEIEYSLKYCERIKRIAGCSRDDIVADRANAFTERWWMKEQPFIEQECTKTLLRYFI